jgi:hypothetical protein
MGRVVETMLLAVTYLAGGTHGRYATHKHA